MDTTVFIASKGRLDIYVDEADTARILKEIQDNGGALSEYEYYERHKPVYYGIKNSDNGYSPLKFPEPKDYGMTAPELYSKAVTYRDAMKKFLELLIKRKPSMAAEIKKITVLAFPIVIIVFLIFVMVIALGG